MEPEVQEEGPERNSKEFEASFSGTTGGPVQAGQDKIGGLFQTAGGFQDGFKRKPR